MTVNTGIRPERTQLSWEEEEYKIDQEASEEFINRTYGIIDKELFELAKLKLQINRFADIMYRAEFTDEYYKSRDEYRKELEQCILCKKRIDRIEYAINFCKQNLSLEQIEQMKKCGIQFGVLCCACAKNVGEETFPIMILSIDRVCSDES